MLKLNTLIITIIVLFSSLLKGQECPIINDNGSFEDMIYVPGGEPAIGITTGQINNWAASHGTVDYINADWNWYDIDGISSVTGHMCYGNRDSHDHSEGMFTSAKIYGDSDLLYTLSLDYATVCDASQNGYLNIALNNNLSSEGHQWFQYPTPEALPEYFQEIQAVDRFELLPETNFEVTGMSNYEISFVPTTDFDQLWLFTEYQYPQDDFVNCGLMIDNVALTVTTSAVDGIKALELTNNNYHLVPEFSKPLNVQSYHWTIDQVSVGTNEELIYDGFAEEVYLICVDIVDDRGACGSACHELDLRPNSDGLNFTTDTDFDACTYSACLDFEAASNIVSLEFMTEAGGILKLDYSSDGFFFPYCIGEASLCAGGNIELGLLVEDLNDYFNNNDLNSKAILGYSEEASDIDCRSMGISILSSDLVPRSILVSDFISDDVSLREIDFDFDPSNCTSGFIEEQEEIDFSFDPEALDQNYEDDSEEEQGLNPVVKGTRLYIQADLGNNIVSEGGIYTLSGQLILDVKDYRHEDEINIDFLPTGMYVIRMINKEFQKTGFFFFQGEK